MIRILFFIVALVFFGISAQAQMYGLRNGEKCIVHDIEKGNTLYGISKKYAVNVEQIIEANPWAGRGLSIGETLFIPVSLVNLKEAKKSPQLDGNVLKHEVKKKETLFSLSRRYNIDIKYLLESNPEVADGLKKGMIISIPTIHVNEQALQVTPAELDSLLSHLVAPKETLFGISKLYEVSIEDIKEVNYGMPDGLKLGERIRIPKFIDGYVSKVKEVISVPDEHALTFDSEPLRDIKLGLMLPFSINSNSGQEEGSDDIYQMTDIAFEFYRGVEIALHELSEEGLSAEVFVFDVEKETSSAQMALSRPEFSELDIVFGPLHRTSYIEMAKKAEVMNIPSVSPFTSNSAVLKGNRLASKVSTAETAQAAYLAKYLYTKYEGDTVTLLKNTLEKDKSLYAAFIQSWNEISIDVEGTTVLEQYDIGAYDEEKFVLRMSQEGMNVFAVPSSQRPFVTDLMTKLTSSAFAESQITVFGLEDWLKFENIDAAIKNKFNMRVCASKYLDFDERKTEDFVKTFYERYNTIPSSQGYATIGYDIAKFYLKGFQEHGAAFIDYLDQFNQEGLETGFSFKRSDNGGWENTYCFILKYSEFELVREN